MRTIDNTQRITLDIRDNQTYEQIYIKQYNKGFPIEFEITKNGEPFDLSGCFATFEMKKPDKTVIWYNCDISDNILSVEVTEQMTIVNGKAEFQITLNQGEILITTITGIMKIDKSVIQDGDVDSSSDISIVNEVLLEIKEVKQLVTDAKTYKESAETSASSASTSASNAKISETNAKTSETNSAQNMATTKTYMESASDSASSALESAQNALDSASQAELSMENAVQSEVNAKTSETNSASSATSAENYAIGNTDSAKYYYEQAKSISESFSGALKPMGTVTFANLPNITSATEGDMYNISDEFTTTDEFKEGSGNVIPAGSNIYKTTDGYWDVLAGSPVTGVKGNAETTYRRGNVNITPENIGALAIDGDSSDNIISFESGDGEGDKYVEVPTMSSGETHKSLFAKISTMFKNIRYLFKILGTTNISALGDGTVTGNINTLNYNYNYLNARLGKPAKYSRVSTYSVGDYCMYMDCIYKCIVDVTTPGDFDSSYWEVTDVCNEVDVLKDDVSVLNSSLEGKAASDHNHDDRYYTEPEIDNLLASGYYTGDMNSLIAIGRYWCTNNANMPSNQTWGMCEVIKPNLNTAEIVQILYNNSGIYTRIHANSQWYAWVAKQDAINSNLNFESTGISVNANDGGYAIKNDNRRWRLHANGTNFWLHEFDLDNNILNHYTFSSGNFNATGNITDGAGHTLANKQDKNNANAQTVILSNTQITTTLKNLTFADDIYNYNEIVLKFTIANNYTYCYTIPYGCYDTLWHPIHIAYNSTQYFENVDFQFKTGTTASIKITSQGTATAWNNSVYVKVLGLGKR